MNCGITVLRVIKIPAMAPMSSSALICFNETISVQPAVGGFTKGDDYFEHLMREQKRV